MVSKKIRLGILVMVLVFGMMVVGCPEDNDDSSYDNGGGYSPREEYYHSFRNNSRYSLTVDTYQGSRSLPIGGAFTLWAYTKNITVEYTNN